MTTTTLERPIQTEFSERQNLHDEPKAAEIISGLLHKADELSQDEINRRFALLVTGATQRLELDRHANHGTIDEYAEVVPGANELLDEIHAAAQVVLATENLEDADATITVKYLGVAADMTGDKEIIEKTLEAIHDTKDYSFYELKRALTIALEQDVPFNKTYQDLQRARLATDEVVQYDPTPMSQRPDFDDGDPLAMWLSKREVEMPRRHNWNDVKEALANQALNQKLF